MTRKEFWIHWIVIVLATHLFAVFMESQGAHGVAALAYLIQVGAGFYLAAQRLDDAGYSRWWSVTILIPFAILVIGLLPSQTLAHKAARDMVA